MEFLHGMNGPPGLNDTVTYISKHGTEVRYVNLYNQSKEAIHGSDTMPFPSALLVWIFQVIYLCARYDESSVSLAQWSKKLAGLNLGWINGLVVSNLFQHYGSRIAVIWARFRMLLMSIKPWTLTHTLICINIEGFQSIICPSVGCS